MGVAALMTLAPSLFVIDAISSDPMIIILVIVLFSWAGVEFFIGLSRPFEGIAPSHPLVKIGRMVWPLFIIYSWLDFRNNWTRQCFPLWFYALLISICIIALAVRLWAVWHLGKSFSYDVKRPAGGILVTTGPYRMVRHPAYLAVCILGSFPGLILGSIVGFIGMMATTVSIIVFRTNAEEQMLEEEFADHFIKYKRKTYRLFPFLLAPPELIILIRDQKMIFRHRINCKIISFKNISRVKTSECSIKIKNDENNTLLKIHKEHFKHIDLSELSDYIRTLLSGHQKVDPMRYTSVKFTGCIRLR